jgi:hypothetical protein
MNKTIRVEWLEGHGRSVRLIETAYREWRGKIYTADHGEIVNGSSIPRFLWPLFGSPFVGKHREASVYHDLLCVSQQIPCADTHRMYYDFCREDGVNAIKAWLMYKAILAFGPKWD